MKKRDFYGSLIKKIFGLPLERADYIAGLIGLAGGVFTYIFPWLRNLFNIGGWLIPISLLLALSVYRLILAPYWLYSEEWNKRKMLESELESINAASPNVVIDQFRESPLFRNSPLSNGKVQQFRILQVWFINSPEIPTEKSEAKKVTALIQYFDINAEEPLFGVYGQWAQSTAPNHAGYSGINSEIDIPPGSLPVKLLIALKHLSDGNCYAFSRESRLKYIDGRNPGHELKPGKYRVRVLLNGIGIRQNYDCILENLGIDAILKMELVNDLDNIYG